MSVCEDVELYKAREEDEGRKETNQEHLPETLVLHKANPPPLLRYVLSNYYH